MKLPASQTYDIDPNLLFPSQSFEVMQATPERAFGETLHSHDGARKAKRHAVPEQITTEIR